MPDRKSPRSHAGRHLEAFKVAIKSFERQFIDVADLKSAYLMCHTAMPAERIPALEKAWRDFISTELNDTKSMLTALDSIPRVRPAKFDSRGFPVE